jgi:hypothetical protein
MNLFEKYSYKQKNFALLVIGVLLFAVAYKRSFSTTLETQAYLEELELKKITAKNSQHEISLLQREISNLNALMGKENVDIEKVQQGFLNFFAAQSTHLVVNEIEEVYTFEHPDFKINTFKIDLKGDFLSVLKFTYLFEKKFEEARLIHTRFEIVKNPETQKNELITTLLLQNYVQKK